MIVEECFKWAHQRKAFGKPLIELAVIRAKLAAMFQKVEAAQAYLENISTSSATLYDKSMELTRSRLSFFQLSKCATCRTLNKLMRSLVLSVSSRPSVLVALETSSTMLFKSSVVVLSLKEEVSFPSLSFCRCPSPSS